MRNTDKANVALIQMSYSADPQENLDKCLARIEEATKQGAHIVSTPELFRRAIFARPKTTSISNWPNRFRVSPPKH